MEKTAMQPVIMDKCRGPRPRWLPFMCTDNCYNRVVPFTARSERINTTQ